MLSFMSSSEPVVERISQIVATIFNVPLETVTPDSSPETIESWDSMGALLLTLELEQEFQIELSPEQTEKMDTVGKIAQEIAPLLSAV